MISVSRRRQAICFLIFIYFFPHFLARPLSFSIDQFDSGTKSLVYEGDAEPLLGVIELNTITEFYRVGRATYAQPFHLWDNTTGSLADFTTHFTFMVDIGKNVQIFGDGFAFFLAPVDYPFPPNSNGGGLGLFDTPINFNPVSQSQIVTVEFDAWPNKGWDPAGPHIGININEISSVVYDSWNVSNITGKVGNAWITYNATASNLSVFWTFKNNPNPVVLGTNTYKLTYHVDLRKVLPEWVSIGFSAATGPYPERHVIKSWEFNSNLDFNDEIRSSRNKEKKKKTFLIIVIAVPIFILLLGVVVCWKWRKNYSSDPLVNTNYEGLVIPKKFAYQELVAATNGFAIHRRLGRGGSGQVYRGFLPDREGCIVAVKRIIAESDQEYEKVFRNEVKIISRLIHKNLVQFIGWCHEEGECLLVYAYMANTSLDNHLFGSRTTLQWDKRYNIASGLASALHYLHEDAEQCVIHRDIKPANIMLDEQFSTKLGDFGISKLVDPRFRTQTTTDTRGVPGTLGYMAPEYAMEGRATKESDMYSFGVVVLEIACGRRTYHDGHSHLPLIKRVWQLYLEGNLLDIADERLEMDYDKNQMKILLTVGLWCTNRNSKERPKAGEVMKVLQLEAPLPELPCDMHDSPVLPGLQQQSDSASSQVSSTS